MKTPTQVSSLMLECNCTHITPRRWDQLMEGATKANHRVIDGLVKKMLPDLYESLVLKSYNPYNYFKTNTHLILVHSAIEYFIQYKQ